MVIIVWMSCYTVIFFVDKWFVHTIIPNAFKWTAVLFFAISTFFELLCVILYAFVFPKLPIVKYYRSKAAAEGSKTVSADLAAGGIHRQPEQVKLFDNFINGYNTSIATLSVFSIFISGWSKS